MDKFIIKSDTFVQMYPQKSMAQLMVDSLSTESDEICLIDCSVDRKWSKQQVLDSGLNLAYYLSHELGIGRGEVVCVAANNSDIHAVAFIGILATGAVYCSFQEDCTQYEINGNINKTKPSLIICTNNNYEIIEDVKASSTFIKKILFIDTQSKYQSNCDELSVEEIFQRPRNPEYELPIKTGLTDLATYVMTSGSTGEPKVIRRTNGNQLAMSACIQNKECYPLGPESTHLATGFCHISGQMFLMACISGGAKLAIINDEKVCEDTFEAIHKYRMTSVLLTPVRLNFLAKNDEKFGAKYLNNLKDILTGGSPLTETTYKSIRKNIDHVRIRNCFGMSEIGIGFIVAVEHSQQLSNCLTIGTVCPGVQIKIIDENGVSLPPNKNGEICIKSYQVTPGYLDNPEANSTLFTEDGFLRSGDIGYYDENKFFYIVGRIKDIIIVGFSNIMPSELEGILMTHPNVENAAVVGVNHEVFNEVPFAFVTLTKGSAVSEQFLIDYVDSRVSYYKKLRGGLKILDSFPMTPFKKVNKPELKKLLIK